MSYQPTATVGLAFLLGVLLIVGAAISQHLRKSESGPKSRDDLQEECDDGAAKACYDLGLMWGNGKDGPQDATKSKALVSRACDLGSKEACEFLPMMK